MKYDSSTVVFIPCTETLKNKLGITDCERLVDFELKFSLNRLKDVPEGDFSPEYLKSIHKHLFQDVYEWAGQARNVDRVRGSRSSRLPTEPCVRVRTRLLMSLLSTDRAETNA